MLLLLLMVAMIAPEWWERGQSVVAAGRRVGEGAGPPAARWEKGEPVVVAGAKVGDGAA